jgi:hypothetical protein
VSGAAALIAWKFGTGPDATRSILDAAVDDLGAPGRDPHFGFGRLDLAKAMAGAPETGSIAGKVRRAGGGGLRGATVDCPGAGSDTSAADGSYEITGVSPGNYSCTARKGGWGPSTKPVIVATGETSKLTFKLRKA